MGLPLESAAVGLCTALTGLAVLFFLLAAWRGRWALWVAGWVLAVLTVAFALYFQFAGPDGTGVSYHRIASGMDADVHEIDYNETSGPPLLAGGSANP
jgi:hypothetical protein